MRSGGDEKRERDALNTQGRYRNKPCLPLSIHVSDLPTEREGAHAGRFKRTNETHVPANRRWLATLIHRGEPSHTRFEGTFPTLHALVHHRPPTFLQHGSLPLSNRAPFSHAVSFGIFYQLCVANGSSDDNGLGSS